MKTQIFAEMASPEREPHTPRYAGVAAPYLRDWTRRWGVLGKARAVARILLGEERLAEPNVAGLHIGQLWAAPHKILKIFVSIS